MATIEEIVRRLEAQGVECQDLDDRVHDAKGEEAADINNSGLEVQVSYLYGPAPSWDEVKADLAELGLD